MMPKLLETGAPALSLLLDQGRCYPTLPGVLWKVVAVADLGPMGAVALMQIVTSPAEVPAPPPMFSSDGGVSRTRLYFACQTLSDERGHRPCPVYGAGGSLAISLPAAT